ncbi:MAG: HipA N-terminal domain-containing protein [Bacteroidota bacterium]
MRSAEIYYKEILAGELTETDDGDYLFRYDPDYIKNFPDQFISFSFPVETGTYRSNQLFSFFDGLIPEGWLLEIASRNWKINQNDRMGLLLACCKDCIGAVSVILKPAS